MASQIEEADIAGRGTDIPGESGGVGEVDDGECVGHEVETTAWRSCGASQGGPEEWRCSTIAHEGMKQRTPVQVLTITGSPPSRG